MGILYPWYNYQDDARATTPVEQAYGRSCSGGLILVLASQRASEALDTHDDLSLQSPLGQNQASTNGPQCDEHLLLGLRRINPSTRIESSNDHFGFKDRPGLPTPLHEGTASALAFLISTLRFGPVAVIGHAQQWH